MNQPAESFRGQPSDGQLLVAFVQRHEQAAFTQIVRRHGDMVWAVCLSVLGNGTDAQDAAQAVFMTLAHKASSLQARATLAGWLHRVAWYVATRAAAAAAVRRQHEREAARMNQKPRMLDQGADLPADRLHEGLSKLPEKYRLPLILHHLEGRSQEEVAVLLCQKTGTVVARLSRGRAMLRKHMLKGGMGVTAVALTATLGAQASASIPATVAVAITSSAAAVLTGKAAAVGVVSAKSLALSKGALQMLYVAKLKLAALYITAALVLGGGAVGGYVVAVGAANSPPPQGAATRPAKLPPTATPAAMRDKSSAATLEEKLYEEVDRLRAGFDTPFDVVESRCAKLLQEYTEPADQAKIYFELAQVEGQSGLQHPQKIMDYIQKALSLPLPPEKRLRLYIYWGDVVQVSRRGVTGEELLAPRKDAALAYLAGLKESLKYDLPETKPEAPPRGAVLNYDGPTDTKEYKDLVNKIKEQNEARQKAALQKVMIEYRDVLDDQISLMYSGLPFANDEIEALAKDVLKDQRAVNRLMAKVNARVKERVQQLGGGIPEEVPKEFTTSPSTQAASTKPSTDIPASNRVPDARVNK